MCGSCESLIIIKQGPHTRRGATLRVVRAALLAPQGHWLALQLAGVLVACGGTVAKPPPAPISNAAAHSCTEAAERLEHATRDLRDPEQSILVAMRTRCTEDRWPGAAVDCFAQMFPEELGTCAGKLATEQREAMFAAFGSSIAVAVAKLKALHVGIPDCDQLIGAFVTVLTCDKLAFAQRLEIGNNADFWALPEKLPPEMAARMASSCKGWYVELKAQVGESGCMP